MTNPNSSESLVPFLQLGERGEVYHRDLEEFIPDSEAIANVHIKSASSHGSSGFEPLNFNVVEFPYQRADCISVTGQAGTTEEVRAMAPFVFPGFSNAVKHLKRSRKPLLEGLEEVLLADEPIEIDVASDHRNPLATAVAPHIVATALFERGNVSSEDLNFEIVVSDMIKFTQFLGEPTIELMRKHFDSIRTVSPSNSLTKPEFPEGYPGRKNQAVSETRALYVAKSKLVGVSPSATTDIARRMEGSTRPSRLLTRSKEPDTYIMCPPSDGTIREYVAGKAVVACGLDFKDGAYFFADKLFRSDLTGDEPSHHLREAGAELMDTIANGISTASSRASGLRSMVAESVAHFQELRSKD